MIQKYICFPVFKFFLSSLFTPLSGSCEMKRKSSEVVFLFVIKISYYFFFSFCDNLIIRCTQDQGSGVIIVFQTFQQILLRNKSQYLALKTSWQDDADERNCLPYRHGWSWFEPSLQIPTTSCLFTIISSWDWEKKYLWLFSKDAEEKKTKNDGAPTEVPLHKRFMCHSLSHDSDNFFLFANTCLD